MSIVQARVPVVWRPQPRQAEFMSRRNRKRCTAVQQAAARATRW